MNSAIEQMLKSYHVENIYDRKNAMKEIMQEIVLCGLSRAGFFKKAAFYGGTALRIFYGLDRFSEDLDFSLLTADADFSLEPYFKALREEFSAFGIEVEIAQRVKSVQSAVVSAFLKKGTSLYDVKVAGQRTLKIKFEVDTDPPGGFATEENLLVQPYSFYVQCYALPDLFAGKMHALLFRRWKNRVKGRDWFDFEWYVQNATPLNLRHLEERARQSGDWQTGELTRDDFFQLLRERIQMLDVNLAKRDVQPFVRSTKVLDIWSSFYFQDLAGKVVFV